MTSKQKEGAGMKKVLLYVLIPLCLVFVVIKWVIPTVDSGADPPSVKQKSVAVLRKWDEGQLKQFDREDRVGTTYTLGGLEVETLKVEPRDTVRTTSLLRVSVSKEKLVQVGTGSERFLALTVTIQNQSADPLEISKKLGEYETKGERTAVIQENHTLTGTYRAEEERTGILFIPTKQRKLTSGYLDLAYQTRSGEQQIRIPLNQQKN